MSKSILKSYQFFEVESLKVARVVSFKLGFMDWFFYNLITLIKCKIPNKDVDKESSIVFEKQGILSGKMKLDEL